MFDGFATELTSHNVIEKGLKVDGFISKEHIDDNTTLRRKLKETGVKPDELPAAEDVKKLQRKLKAAQEKLTEKIKMG